MASAPSGIEAGCGAAAQDLSCAVASAPDCISSRSTGFCISSPQVRCGSSPPGTCRRFCLVRRRIDCIPAGAGRAGDAGAWATRAGEDAEICCAGQTAALPGDIAGGLTVSNLATSSAAAACCTYSLSTSLDKLRAKLLRLPSAATSKYTSLCRFILTRASSLFLYLFLRLLPALPAPALPASSPRASLPFCRAAPAAGVMALRRDVVIRQGAALRRVVRRAAPRLEGVGGELPLLAAWLHAALALL